MRASTLRTAAGLTRLIAPYVALGALRHVVPIATLARWAWRQPRGARDRRREQRIIAEMIKIGHLSGAAERHCLPRSLLLYRELSRAGADPSLVIGFQRAASGVSGHAWVVVDGHPVAESAEAIMQLVPACVFGRHGRRQTS